MTQTYSKKSNARRAAVTQLGADAVDGTDFHLSAVGGGWSWQAGPQAATQAAPAAEGTTGEAQAPLAGPSPDTAPDAASDSAQGTAERKRRSGTKQEIVIGLLRRAEGATAEQMMEATGWQKHTVRGAIAGALKKKLGLAVTSEKVENRGTVYRLPAEA